MTILISQGYLIKSTFHLFSIFVIRVLQNRTGHPKTEPTPAVAKKSQTEGFSSVLVFASGVTRSFWFHCFPACEIEFLPRTREREGGRASNKI